MYSKSGSDRERRLTMAPGVLPSWSVEGAGQVSLCDNALALLRHTPHLLVQAATASGPWPACHPIRYPPHWPRHAPVAYTCPGHLAEGAEANNYLCVKSVRICLSHFGSVMWNMVLVKYAPLHSLPLLCSKCSRALAAELIV